MASFKSSGHKLACRKSLSCGKSISNFSTVPKVSVPLSTDSVAQGDLLYWDAANSRLTKTDTSNTLAGYAAAAAGAAVTTVDISINA